MKTKFTKQWIFIICFGILMVGLGSSDALRGIFAPVFQERYELNDSQLSLIVTASYIGNLLFLSVGGRLLDRFNRKKVMIGTVCIWICAILLNLVTDRYEFILISMFLGLGASTLLNTTINILTPVVCAGLAGLMVNVFFFIQGIGTSGSQFLLGRYAFDYSGWKWINFVLLLIGAVAVVLLLLAKLSGTDEREKAESKTETKTESRGEDMSGLQKSGRVFWILVAMLGCYFIGEHGIMNWLLSYCISAFSMAADRASVYLSVFWGGMTIGRLLFAPVVQKMGTKKSLKLFGGAGTILFCLGILLGETGILLLSLSGFAISIIYPTTILFFQQIYPASVAATKTGTIISLATIADILFNLAFGMIIDWAGYRSSFLILLVCMAGFYVLYLTLLKIMKRGVKEAV